MNEDERLVELEIRLAFQEDLLTHLNSTIAKMHEQIDLQQKQLQYLYQKIVQQEPENAEPYRLEDEIPPHY